MKSQQLLLPILIGFSSVGIALVYLFYKKKNDIDKYETVVPSKKRHKEEMKVPKQYVPVLIGRGGSTIKDIQKRTNTYITFDAADIENPDRTCVIKGTLDCIDLAKMMIKDIIANQPVIETYETYVPQRVCNKIMEKGRGKIQQIQLQTGTKMIVDEKFIPQHPHADQRIIIKGTAEQIAAALEQLEDIVKEEKQEGSKSEINGTVKTPRAKLSPRNTNAVNSSDTVSQPAEVLSQQDVSGLMEVYVSAMVNPSQFWVQIIGSGTTALNKLVNEMTTYYNNDENQELHSLNNITEGQMVAAKFSYDGRWYRGEVLSTPTDGKCEVYFIDYGDQELVATPHILELRTDFLSLKLQAIECSLANVKSR